MVGGSRCDLRACRHNIRMLGPDTAGCAICGRPLHHGSILVYSLYVVRKSGRDDGPVLSDTFAGIAPAGVLAFILAQLVGMLIATIVAKWLWPSLSANGP